MTKKITDWKIKIPTTSDRNTEESFMRAFLDHYDEKETTVNFNANLVGYNEDWGDVIETSRIISFIGNETCVYFTTFTGSVYVASRDDFNGFFCRTGFGDKRVLPIR